MSDRCTGNSWFSVSNNAVSATNPVKSANIENTALLFFGSSRERENPARKSVGDFENGLDAFGECWRELMSLRYSRLFSQPFSIPFSFFLSFFLSASSSYANTQRLLLFSSFSSRTNHFYDADVRKRVVKRLFSGARNLFVMFARACM